MKRLKGVDGDEDTDDVVAFTDDRRAKLPVDHRLDHLPIGVSGVTVNTSWTIASSTKTFSGLIAGSDEPDTAEPVPLHLASWGQRRQGRYQPASTRVAAEA